MHTANEACKLVFILALNTGQTSLVVQNRGISRTTKRTNVVQKFSLKIRRNRFNLSIEDYGADKKIITIMPISTAPHLKFAFAICD